jgi:HD-GYP domain-containing protein (c-di-GMP phosphodiesterase class II)
VPDQRTTSAHDPVAERLLAEQRQRRGRGLTRAERLTYWTSGVAFAGAALALVALGGRGSLPSSWVVALLLVSYAVATRLEFEVGSALAVPTELVLVPMLFLLPPTQVPIWVAAATVLAGAPEYLLGIVPPERALVAVGSSWFSLGPALVFVLFHSPGATVHSWRTPLVLALALVAQFGLDLVSSAARERAALGVPVRQVLAGMPLVFAIDLVLAPAGLLTAIAAREGRAALLLPLPLFFVVGLSSRERQRRIDHELELSSAYRGTAFLLGDVVEADDEYTGRHSRDVLELVLAVCEELGLDARARLDAEFAALLHDVGKIRIPASIINKPGPLTPGEWAIVNLHTLEGQLLLERVGGRLGEIGRIVRSCHERWDGTGYPDRLAGEEIPVVSRIVCCCDAFSAMTTNRPYRRALTPEQALAELEQNAGTQFDPRVAATLAGLVRSRRVARTSRPELVVVPAPAPAAAQAVSSASRLRRATPSASAAAETAAATEVTTSRLKTLGTT